MTKRGDGSRPLDDALRTLRRLRGPDGALQCLLAHSAAERSRRASGRRRVEVVQRATREHGIDVGLAATVYDIAVEEGLEPDLAVALVACGVTVRGAEPSPDAAHQELPEWLVAPPAGGAFERERRLRSSFRRLRGLLERCDSAESALRVFVEEPDAEVQGY